MKIENISSKVIGIGNVTVLPGETQVVPSDFENSPVLEIYKSVGFINITGEATAPKAPAVEESPVIEEAPAVDEAESKKAKLALLKTASDEVVAKMANELGINPADCKDLADVRKKVKEALS
jgi:hypothetical protein